MRVSKAGDVVLLSNYGLVVHYFYLNPRATMREASAALGLTERTVYELVDQLESDSRGFMKFSKKGRRVYRMPETKIAKAIDRLIKTASEMSASPAV